ncbi:MAG: hypothetical protein Q4P71_07030 [Actinomycetaceae bacterium]|nr:hypothetical protein [Actinomycetaceae bacterium]
MRDLRDTSLRCLRLSSISDGLSKYLIDQIVFAMLQYNTGVEALANLTLLDDPEHGAGQLSVNTDDCVAVVRRTEDRQFCPLFDSHRVFDFASAERSGVTVFPDGFPSDSPLAALAMRKASGNVDRVIVALNYTDDGWKATVATPDGDYGTAGIDDMAAFLKDHCDLSSEQLNAVDKYQAQTVIALIDSNPLDAEAITRADDFQARHNDALTDGLNVDSDLWEKVRAHSRDFLVDLPA